MEHKEYEPSLKEWDELVLLWDRSRAMFSSTRFIGVVPRVAWVTKNFVEKHPQVAHRDVYAWLIQNLEIARGDRPEVKATEWHDEPTAVHVREPKETPHEHIQTPAYASPGHSVSTSALAAGPCVHR